MSIKVFIGTEPKTEIARKVLEFSILQNTEQSIEFPPLCGEESWDVRPPTRVGTGFSLLRWKIPELCDYKGYAIYLDADMLVFSDIKDLWQSDVIYPNDKCSVWCTYQESWGYVKTLYGDKEIPETSVMFIDCAKAKTNQQDFDTITIKLLAAKDREYYVKVMRALNHIHAPQRIPNNWNHLNNYKDGKTKLLHYTIEPKQPWYDPSHPHKNLWRDALREALADGYVKKEEVKKAVENFRPHTKAKRGEGMHPYWAKFA